MGNIKVLFCSPINGAGGVAMWTKHILNYYKDKGFRDVEMFWMYPQLQKREMTEGTSMFTRLKLGVQNYLPMLKLLNKELKDNNYNIVHFSSSAGFALIRDLLSIRIAHNNGVKAIVHFHFGRIPNIFSKRGWERKLIAKVFREADGVIVLDQVSYNSMQENGFCNMYKLPNSYAEIVRKFILNHSFERKHREILFVGHLYVTKGVIELVKACKQIVDIHVTMIGKGSEEVISTIKSAAGNDCDSWLTFTGVQPLELVLENMMSCAIFVLPTYTEGFPNVIIESMACGCPIITTDVGAIPEMLDIEHGNNFGICVKPKQVDELRNAIINMLENRVYAETCGRNAQLRVNELYSMPKVWKQMVEIWEEVASK